MTGPELAAWHDSVLALSALDCLKLWPASYGPPNWNVGFCLARHDGRPRLDWFAVAEFNLN